MAGRIIGVKVLAFMSGFAGLFHSPHYLVRQLHSTKGWGPRERISARSIGAGLKPGYYRNGRAKLRGLTCDGSRLQLNRDLVHVRPKKIKLERHGWYRRQQRKEAARAQAV